MAPWRSGDRDIGMRKISFTTRALAVAGVVATGALSLFVADRASGSSNSSPSVSAPSTTLAPSPPNAAPPATRETTPYVPQPTIDPSRSEPRPHTRTGGS